MTDAVLSLAFDPALFDVSAADVQMGTVPLASTGWQLQTEVNDQAGLIGIELHGSQPILTSAGGSLVTITLHPRAGARRSAMVNGVAHGFEQRLHPREIRIRPADHEEGLAAVGGLVR